MHSSERKYSQKGAHPRRPSFGYLVLLCHYYNRNGRKITIIGPCKTRKNMNNQRARILFGRVIAKNDKIPVNKGGGNFATITQIRVDSSCLSHDSSRLSRPSQIRPIPLWDKAGQTFHNHDDTCWIDVQREFKKMKEEQCFRPSHLHYLSLIREGERVGRNERVRQLFWRRRQGEKTRRSRVKTRANKALVQHATASFHTPLRGS